MFSFSLYKVGLRKALPMGITYALLAIFGGIGFAIIQIQSYERFGTRVQISGLSVNPIAFPAVLLALVLVMSLFAFLHERSGSDFFHAAPHKRESIYFSTLAAILTWTIPILWISVLAPALVYSTSSNVTIVMSSILISALGLTVATLLVMAATMLAMSATGVGFSAFILTGIILFIPRAVIAMLIMFFTEAVWIVDGMNFGILGNHSLNIVFGTITEINQNTRWQNQPWQPIFYTLILAIVYFAIALFVFKKRRSEQAGFAGANPISQSIIRIAIGFLITTPIFGMVLMPGETDIITRFTAILGIVFGVVFFCFINEVISNRRLPTSKEWSKIAISLFVIAALNVGGIGVMVISRNSILNREITVNNVSGVSVYFPSNNWGRQAPSYAELRARDIDFTDDELIAAFITSLDEYIAANRRGDSHRWNYSSGTQTSWQNWNPRVNPVNVTFTVNGRSVRRHLRPTRAHGSAIYSILLENQDYQQAHLSLPENPTLISMEDVWHWCEETERSIYVGELSSDQLKEVYQLLREEVATLPFAVWYNQTGSNWLMHRDFDINDMEMEFDEHAPDHWPTFHGQIFVQGMLGGREYFSRFSITSSTPRTAEMFNGFIEAMAVGQ